MGNLTIIKTHPLKIIKEYFDLQLKGKKNWEIRKNDRDFKEGDFIMMSLVDGNGELTSSYIHLKIDYVYKGNEYGLKEGYCILSTSRVQH